MSEPTPSRTSAGRVVATVAGALTVLLALGAIAVGGVLLWGDAQKGDDGYLSTAAERFRTETAAIATDDLDVDTDGPDFLLDSSTLGHVRVRATSRTDKPIFVGIAPTREVEAYLRGTSHATLTDVDFDPFEASYRTRGGGRPHRPAAQPFWSASSTGKGTRTVEWKVTDGSWSIVVMNADGSRNVAADVSAATDAPWLPAAGWVSLGGGLLLLAIGGPLMVFGLRRPRERREPGGAVPAAA